MRKWLILFCVGNLYFTSLIWIHSRRQEQEIRVLVDCIKVQTEINRNSVVTKDDLYEILKKARR